MAPPRILTHHVDVDSVEPGAAVRCSWCGERIAALIELDRFHDTHDEGVTHIVLREGWSFEPTRQVYRLSNRAKHRISDGLPSRKYPPQGSHTRRFTGQLHELHIITQKHDAYRIETRTTPVNVMCSCGGVSRLESAVALDTARPVRTIQVVG